MIKNRINKKNKPRKDYTKERLQAKKEFDEYLDQF